MQRLTLISHGKTHTILYDAADQPVIDAHSWFIHTRGYVGGVTKAKNSKGKRTSVFLHRVIMGAIKHTFIDHINGDKLDNRRENLRFATPSQNRLNQNNSLRKDSTTGFRGVTQHTPTLWKARVGVGGKMLLLGYFNSPEAASEAYQSAVKKIVPAQCEAGPAVISR